MKRLLSVSLALLALSACGRPASEGRGRQQQQGVYGDAIPVETLVLEAQTYDERYAAPGVIEASEDVTVSAEVAGRIVGLEREIGDAVREGEPLLSLDDRLVRARVAKLRAQLERARTQLEWARKDLERQERLFRTEVAAERARDEARRQVDTGENDVAAQEAELEMAMVELSLTQIRSPIDGTIAERHVAPGEYVTPGTPLYDVVATREVKFVFSVAERDVIGVRLAQQLEVAVDAHGGRRFAGIIRAISPAGRGRTRTFRVELGLVNPASHPLLPGMSGTAEVVRAQHQNVFLLPEAAILRDGAASYVYLANDAHARRVEVEIRSQVGAMAVVDAPFDGEYDCIILGQAAVHDGSAIRVRRRHQAPPGERFD